MTYARFRSVAQAGQIAVNLSIYAGLVAVMPVLLKERSLEHFLKFVVLCFIPWSVLGLKQYFFGFDRMEWFYAETGLSPVATSQFFAGIQHGEPGRWALAPALNFGVVCLLLPISVWMLVVNKSQRFLWATCTTFILAAMIVSLQRAAMILPLIGLVFISSPRPGRDWPSDMGAVPDRRARNQFSDVLLEHRTGGKPSHRR